MVVYFIDGKLTENIKSNRAFNYIIDAGDGFTACMGKLREIKDEKYIMVLTNFLPAIDSEFTWSEDSNIHKAFIYNPVINEWMHVSTFFKPRELREAHNLPKIYANSI